MKIVRLEVVVILVAVTTRMQAALSRHNHQHGNKLVKARSVRNIVFSLF
jgi:predicted GIY-YIG superfamily endonuclease